MGRIALENDLIAERQNWRRGGSRVVLVRGVFDLLHPGHIRLLEQAKSLGDVLVVAVRSDARFRPAGTARIVHQNDLESESSRPTTPAAERAEILSSLAAVDYVVELDAASLADFARRFVPDVLVKGTRGQGSGLTEDDFSASEIVKDAGGTVIEIPLEPGYSTKSLMERIRQLRA